MLENQFSSSNIILQYIYKNHLGNLYMLLTKEYGTYQKILFISWSFYLLGVLKHYR